jgi:hypothetical protein
MLVGYVVLALLHAADPAKHAPPGGVHNFTDSLNFLGALVLVAGTVVGATVGTGDLGAGVFRELVMTGRSRLALFGVRVPAGLAFLLLAVALAAALSAGAAALLPTDGARASADLVLASAGWLALVASASFALALGISSLLSSRGISIAVLLGWQVIVMPLLLQLKALGSVREGLLAAPIERFEPAAVLGHPVQAPMSLAAALVVVAAWTLVPVALGAWRTVTRDI